MYLFFDIGGSNTRIALSTQGKQLDKVEIIPTEKDFGKAMHQIEEMGKHFSEGKNLKMVIGGVPGPLDKKKTQLINAPNLSSWNYQPLKEAIKKMFGCPVIIENDTELAGLGEARYGAGKGSRIVVYLTISTGIGGVRIVGEKIDENTLGFEPGAQIIVINDQMMTLENCVSGTAIKKIYKEAPAKITDKRKWREIAKILSIGINNTIVHWSPDVVVLGGSVMKTLPIELIQTEVENTVKIFPEVPKIVQGSLGDYPGLYGALALLSDKTRKI